MKSVVNEMASEATSEVPSAVMGKIFEFGGAINIEREQRRWTMSSTTTSNRFVTTQTTTTTEKKTKVS